MLQLCNHPLSLLMFKEKLGIATTSRYEQHEVQYFQEEIKTKFVFYNFFCTCGFRIFSIWVKVYEIFCFDYLHSSSRLRESLVERSCLVERLLLEDKTNHLC
jgi:hypothetical protein